MYSNKKNQANSNNTRSTRASGLKKGPGQKYANKKSKGNGGNKNTKTRNNGALSLSQLLGRIKKQRRNQAAAQGATGQQNRQTFARGVGQQNWNKRPIKPIIPPKSLVIILKQKPEKTVYNRRIIDYKHSGLLQRYIGLGGKILPRRQTRLTAKQQRYVAKTIKTARIMGLLPFVSKERGFFK